MHQASYRRLLAILWLFGTVVHCEKPLTSRVMSTIHHIVLSILNLLGRTCRGFQLQSTAVISNAGRGHRWYRGQEVSKYRLSACVCPQCFQNKSERITPSIDVLSYGSRGSLRKGQSSVLSAQSYSGVPLPAQPVSTAHSGGLSGHSQGWSWLPFFLVYASLPKSDLCSGDMSPNLYM